MTNNHMRFVKILGNKLYHTSMHRHDGWMDCPITQCLWQLITIL